MISRKSKVMCTFLAFLLSFSLFPLSSYGSEPVKELPEASRDSVSDLIPTDEQLDEAAPDQLIVTYASETKMIHDKIEVAPLDDRPLDDVASSEPEDVTTLSELGVIQEGSIDSSSSDEPESSLLTFDPGVDLQEISAQLLSSPDVESVQPNYKYELSAVGSTSYYDQSSNRPAKHPTNDPYSYVSSGYELNQNYIYTTKIADAWGQGYKTSGKVSVAVIDSGPRVDHPDLASALDLTYARDFTTTSYGNGVPYKDNPSYWTGKTGYECHGTWVSGVLAATANNGIGIAGASYNANVIPIKVTDGRTLYTSTIVRAYSYLDSLIESKKLSSLKVINLSLGGRASDSALKNAITHMATSHNILTVAAAGNYGDADHMYPADYSNVLSVMSTNPDYTRASFSNYGGKDVSAPGTLITTTSPYSGTWSSSAKGKYTKYDINGTSFSAPIAAGVAAMCYAAKPTATAAEVRYAIKSSAVSLTSIDSTCAPYLNALQAVKNTLNGKGLYEATHISLAGAKVSSIATRTYTGKKFVPKPKVTLSGKTLKRGVDYTLSYSNNKNPGKATITIKGIGKYKSSKKVTFKIIPKSSKILSVKRGVGSLTVKWQKRTTSASGYQIRRSTSSKRLSSKKLKTGRTYTVVGKKRNSLKLKGLKRWKKYYVQVRSYKKVSGIKYYSKWSSIKSAKTK